MSSSGALVLPGYECGVCACVSRASFGVPVCARNRVCLRGIWLHSWRAARRFNLLWESNATIVHGTRFYLHVKASSTWGGTSFAVSSTPLTVDLTPPALSAPLPATFGPAHQLVMKQTGAPEIAFLWLDANSTQVRVGVRVYACECVWIYMCVCLSVCV